MSLNTVANFASLASARRRRRSDWLGSVDVHCHCLPGIDDGPANWSESIALSQLLVEDGIKFVVATPHQLGSSNIRGSEIRSLVCELQSRLNQEKIPLDVIPGADVRIDERLLPGIDSGDVLTLGDQRHVILLEMPHDVLLDIEVLLQELAAREMVAVITHPERHPEIARRPEVVLPWVQAGAVLQLTAGSLCGDFGQRAHVLAWSLVEAGLVSVVASDAHDSVNRPPRMSSAYQLLETRLSKTVADALCIQGPSALLDLDSIRTTRAGQKLPESIESADQAKGVA